MQEEQGYQMAQQGCESCRKWQEHYYWEHMDVSKIRFIKLMTGDFAQGISIPEKFVNNFKGQITNGFNLKAPSGETWHVGVNKIADEMYLMSGWDDFAKAHELKQNDLLLFTCSGNSSFEVLIFDASGCEKLSSLFADKTGSKMRKHFDNVVGQQVEQYSLSDSDDTSMPSQLVGSPHKASTSKKFSGKTKQKGKEPESPNSSSYHVKHEEIEESDDRYANSNYYYSRVANRLIDEEKEKIIGLGLIQPDNPAFVTVLLMSHVRHRSNFLIIPGEFAAEHLERRSHDILLRRPNRKEKWYVRYYHTSSTRGFKCQRWVKFVRDNRLREGYICVFELIRGARRVTMTVHVVRKVGERFVIVAG